MFNVKQMNNSTIVPRAKVCTRIRQVWFGRATTLVEHNLRIAAFWPDCVTEEDILILLSNLT